MRRITRPLILTAAAATLALTSCGSSDGGDINAADDSAFAATLGACEHDPTGVEREPAANFLAHTQTWIELDAKASSLADTVKERSHTQTRPVVARRVLGADSEDQFTPTTIRAHGSLLRGDDWVASHGGKSYLGFFGSPDTEPAAFALVFTPGNDDAAFAGSCQYDALWKPLHEQFKAETVNKLRAIVGKSGPQLAQLLGLEKATPPSTQPVLNPQDSDPATLSRYTLVSVTYQVPDDWSGPYTVCSKIAAGWNDCIDLAGGRDFDVTAYVDPGAKLEVWLLDADANLSAPRQLLGRVTVPTSLGDQPHLTLTLTGAFDAAAGRVASPALSLQ